jgi:hypothetical protein
MASNLFGPSTSTSTTPNTTAPPLPLILQDPPSPSPQSTNQPTRYDDDDKNSFSNNPNSTPNIQQEQSSQSSPIRFDIIIFTCWTLLVTVALVRLFRRKAREHREATGASIFDCGSHQRLRAQEEAQRRWQLDLQYQQRREQQRSRGGVGGAGGGGGTVSLSNLSAEEIDRRAQKRRDAYLDTFQRNQVQLVSPSPSVRPCDDDDILIV